MSDEDLPEIQTGTKAVEPTDLEAAGEGHPLGQEASELTGNLQVLIRDYAEGQYSSWEETIREYIANAETACIRVQQRIDEGKNVIAPDNYEPVIEITWNRKEQKLIIRDNGIGMSSHEFDNGYGHVGASVSRDTGDRLGQFGVGALSFVQIVGIDDHILIKTHSRITDEDYAAYFSLGGPTPLMGGLGEDSYGTEFEMTPKEDYGTDMRDAVEKYSEYCSVPVRYEEYDENGEHAFDEDYGDKRLIDDLSENRVAIEYEKEGYFRAVCAPECEGKTLLVSMPIDRNDGGRGSSKHNAPFTFDVRLLDETGRVVKGPNEGLIPCGRREYEKMLMKARDPYITPDHLDSHDGVEVLEEAGEGSGNYGPAVQVTELTDEELVGRRVVVGENEGKEVVSTDEWETMDEGRAEQYMPRDDLSDDDITMPEPTTDRGRLKENREFWEWLSERVEEKFYSNVSAVMQEVKGADDPVQYILDMDKENLSLAQHGINHVTGQSHSDMAAMFSVSEKTISIIDNLDDNLSVVPEGKWDYPDSRYYREQMDVKEILFSNHSEVYMSVTVDGDKAEKVQEENGLVVDLDHEGLYNKYQIYNWKKLENVST